MARGAAGQSGDPWPWPRPVFEHAILFSISLDVRYWPPVSAEFSKAVYGLTWDDFVVCFIVTQAPRPAR